MSRLTTRYVIPRDRNKRQPLTYRRAAVVVEFAVVLPIIMFFFATMLEISRVLLLQHTADTSAYEGARCGMVPGATAQQATNAAIELLNAAKLKSTVVTVEPPIITESTSLITVSVEVPIALNSWIVPRWIVSQSLKSEVTLFCERAPAVQVSGIPILKAKSSKVKSGGFAL